MRVRLPIRPVHVAVIALIVTVALTSITSTVALLKVSHRADSAKAIAVAIQRERARSVMENCEQQNVRHDQALGVTLALLKRPAVPRKLTPEQKQAQAGAIVEWVDALVPRRDCGLLVQRQVQTHQP
jgi:S1-C subfamily serine protease